MNSKESAQEIQFNRYKTGFNKEATKALTDLFHSKECSNLINECCWFFQVNTLYNPLTTLFTFIKQVLSADKSCKNAVSGVLANEFAEKGTLIGTATGAYVKARQRMPKKMVHDLVTLVGMELIVQAPLEWRPYGRHLKVFDGTTMTMADTQANQAAFPKHSNQNKNIGFPMARLVAVMSLTTGSIIDYALGPCKGKGTGEASLLRTLLPCIEPNDIVIADRYYPHFFLMCDLKNKGVDGVFRAAAQRRYDFRKGKRLGKYDHISSWEKPKKPEWMSQSEYALYPKTLSVREFKESGLIYVTTFLEATKYPKKELKLLYKKRWEVETNLKYIKTIMSMDHLTCKTPDMVEKEIGIHFLAYNMIRNLMTKAAIKHELLPTQLSFKSTIQLVNQLTPLVLYAKQDQKQLLLEILLDCISKNKVANRPGRTEPRAIKRKPKTFPSLKIDRKTQKHLVFQMHEYSHAKVPLHGWHGTIFMH